MAKHRALFCLRCQERLNRLSPDTLIDTEGRSTCYGRGHMQSDDAARVRFEGSRMSHGRHSAELTAAGDPR